MRGLMAFLIAALFLLMAAGASIIWYSGEVTFTYGGKSAGAKSREKKTQPTKKQEEQEKQEKQEKKDQEPEKRVAANKRPTKAPKKNSENSSEGGKQKGGEKKSQTGREVFNVKFPPELNRVKFGMSPKTIAEIYEPAWRKVQGGKTIFAHYPGAKRQKYYVFEFGSSGLESLEVRMKAGEQQELDDLYEQVMARTTTRFGGDAETRRRRWKDKSLLASLRKRGNYVALRFTPRR